MPRIEAPTVAEHRELRRRQIVENAAALLVAQGPEGVTPAAVAQATGLARTSVYQYFPTSAELIAAAVEESFLEASAGIVAAVEAVGPSPRARLRAYLSGVAEAAARGHHPSTLATLSGLPQPCRARLRELHRQMAAPLVAVVADWGAAQPVVAGALVLGAVNEATVLIDQGADRRTVLAEVTAFVEGALDAVSGDGATPQGLSDV